MSAAATPDATAAGAAASAASVIEDIRDIRGPKFVLPPWALPALIAALLLLALAGYALWRWYQRRRRPRERLAHELALQRLDEIRSLMQPEQAREFSIAVSDVVRGYIERRFDLTATHRTTEEFLHDLLDGSHAALARHRGVLSGFLHQCDLVKFAGMSLTVQNMQGLHDSARAFVIETAKPEPATDPNAALPAA